MINTFPAFMKRRVNHCVLKRPPWIHFLDHPANSQRVYMINFNLHFRLRVSEVNYPFDILTL